MEFRRSRAVSSGNNRCAAESEEETFNTVREDEWHGEETGRGNTGTHKTSLRVFSSFIYFNKAPDTFRICTV